ncbi:MAG TPA: hypothetical protein PKM21_11765 [Anaerolineales bacterium]|nr:hypothetical protein [Anaerolineales bacterium]
MIPISVAYRDVTGQVGAAERANPAPHLRSALLDLGFQSVGLLETKAPGMLDAEKMASFVTWR